MPVIAVDIDMFILLSYRKQGGMLYPIYPIYIHRYINSSNVKSGIFINGVCLIVVYECISLCVCVCVWEREREREWESMRETKREGCFPTIKTGMGTRQYKLILPASAPLPVAYLKNSQHALWSKTWHVFEYSIQHQTRTKFVMLSDAIKGFNFYKKK